MTRFVIVFDDPESDMDSGCRSDILGEIGVHGGKIRQFFSVTGHPAYDFKIELPPNAYNGMDTEASLTDEFAALLKMQGRKC